MNSIYFYLMSKKNEVYIKKQKKNKKFKIQVGNFKFCTKTQYSS